MNTEILTPEESLEIAKVVWEERWSIWEFSDLENFLRNAEDLKAGLAKKVPGGFCNKNGLCNNLAAPINRAFIGRLVGAAALQFDWCDCSEFTIQVECEGKIVSLPVYPIGGEREYGLQAKWSGESLAKRRELLDAVIVLLRGLIECLEGETDE